MKTVFPDFPESKIMNRWQGKFFGSNPFLLQDKFGRIQQANLTWHGEVLVLRNVSFSRNCSRSLKFSHILFYGSSHSLELTCSGFFGWVQPQRSGNFHWQVYSDFPLENSFLRIETQNWDETALCWYSKVPHQMNGDFYCLLLNISCSAKYK